MTTTTQPYFVMTQSQHTYYKLCDAVLRIIFRNVFFTCLSVVYVEDDTSH